MARKIKTYIKFSKGLDNVADKVYGFVTKKNGSWRGCRDTEEKKKIVLVAPELVDGIIPDMLYSCSLTPMRNDKGFIANSANLVKFKGTISSICRGDKFIVNVQFGNRLFTYDPSSNDRRKNDIQGIAEALRTRVDLENAAIVAEDFVNDAFVVRRMYKESRYNA